MNRRAPAFETSDGKPPEPAAGLLSLPCLGVVMPVFNEATTVAEVLKRVLAQPCVQEVIAIDDGSTDGTAGALREWPASDPRVQVVRHPVNRGKGAAVRTGLARIMAPLVIIQDADLEYDPQDYARIIEPLQKDEALVVYGSRYLDKSMAGGHGSSGGALRY